MLLFFLLLLLLRTQSTECRWRNPNVYAWLEQNSYICYLELKSPHDLRFLYKDEAEKLKCSCGDPLLTQSACARSNNLKRPFCSKLPDPCMKAYATIFMPSNRTKVNLTDLQLSSQFSKINKTAVFATGLKTGTRPLQNQAINFKTKGRDEFFTLAPRFVPLVGKIQKSTDPKTTQQQSARQAQRTRPLESPSPIPARTTTTTLATPSSPGFSPNTKTAPPSPLATTTVPFTTASGHTSSTGTTAGLVPSPVPLLGSPSVEPKKEIEGIEAFLNNTEAVNKLMDILIKRLVESGRTTNSTLFQRLEGVKLFEPAARETNKPQMIKMLSSHEEEGPVQRVIFTETMNEEDGVLAIEKNLKEPSQENDTLVLRPQGPDPVSPSTTTLPPPSPSAALEGPLIISAPVTSVPIRIKGPKGPRRNKTLFHDTLIRLQKKLFNILGEKFDDLEEEDGINDNDIITVFREHMHDSEGGSLAFSDDKMRDDSGEQTEDDGLFPQSAFNPKVCEDNHPLCEFWALYKRCRPHAGYMYKYCRKACGICE